MCLALGTVQSAFLYAQCFPYFVRKVGITIIILTFFVSVPRPVPVPCTPNPSAHPPRVQLSLSVGACAPHVPHPPSLSLPILVLIPHCYNKVSYRIDLRKKRFILPPWQERPGSEEEAADDIAAAGRKQKEMKAPAQGPLSPLYSVQDSNL